jgi:O-antigen/teichoic acid export membrane protein
MNTRERLVLVKNAAANVLRGGAAALVALLLPPFLTRLMTPEAFGAWSLVLQLSAFAGYLDFGIQTAIGRFVAHTGETGDAAHRNRIINTSLTALTSAGALGVAGCAGLALLLPRIFHQIPPGFLHDSRWALVLVGGSLAVGLPCSVFNGIFVGLQRYEIPAVVIGGSRLFSAALLVLIVKQGGSIASMAASVATVNLVSYALQYLLYRKLALSVSFGREHICKYAGRQLFDYCFSLTVWSFATLLVTGLDIALVGFFDFHFVAYYAAAATLITFVLGLQNAIFTAMIPAAAVLEARNDTSELGRILLTTSRYGMFLLLASGVPLLLATKPILSLWVGADYATHASLILQVLVAANIIRLSAVPYAMLLIGTGQQRLVTVSPLLEGFSNLAVSIVAGALFGAIGVAIGTFVGAIVGIVCNFVYNLPRSKRIAVSRALYLRDGYLRPLASVAPVLLVFPLRQVLASDVALATLITLLILFVTWVVGLSSAERGRLSSWLGFAAILRAGART